MVGWTGTGRGEVPKINWEEVRKEFIKALESVLKNDIELLPIPSRVFRKTKRILTEIIDKENATFTDADTLFPLHTSEKEFIRALMKYLPGGFRGDADPYLGRMPIPDARGHYITPSGNMIRFEYQ